MTKGKASFDSPGTIAALKFWQDSINRKVSPRTVKNGNSGDILGNLGSGYCGMQQMVSSVISILNTNAPDFRYGTFKLPRPADGEYWTTSGGWAAVVNKNGKNPEAAAKFVGTTLRDRPSAATLARLRLTHPGRIVSVRIRDREGFQTVLASTFLAHSVAAEIIFGGIDELQDKPVGSLTFELVGEPGAIDAAIAALRADGIDLTEETGATEEGAGDA